jgi:hypothetical protein
VVVAAVTHSGRMAAVVGVPVLIAAGSSFSWGRGRLRQRKLQRAGAPSSSL